MKQFRKNQENLFVCEECGFVIKLKHHLSQHINRYHNGQKEYYDKWIKNNKNDGLCKNCKKETKFTGFKNGYDKTCCKKCKYEYNKILYIERYGEHPLKNKTKEKETKLKLYGDEHYSNRKKSKQTCLKKYGVEYVFQNRETHEKGQRTKLEFHRYKDTNIWYQASYELDFLEKYYDKYPDIKRGPTIRYMFEDKKKIYFPDFYIPSLNLIIECKNKYLVKKYNEQNIAKQKATIANGFKYIMIIDKDYTKFNLLQLTNVQL